MPNTSRIPTHPSTAPRPGDPDYSLLVIVAGTLLQVGTQATAYVSSFALAPRSERIHEVPA